MAITHTYADSVSGDDTTGDGSKGNPWQTFSKIESTTTRDGTNGNQLNLKGTFNEAFSLSNLGGGSVDAPVIIRGYTTDENDGGRFTCNAGSSQCLSEFSNNYIHLFDGDFEQTNTGRVIQVGTECMIANITVNGNGNAVGGIRTAANSVIESCHVYDIDGSGTGNRMIDTSNYCIVKRCYVVADASAGTIVGIYGQNETCVEHCIVDLDSAAGYAIEMGRSMRVQNCTLLGGGSTGKGIRNSSGIGEHSVVCYNIIANFSGTGAEGVELDSGSSFGVYGYNAFYNNTTNEDLAGEVWYNFGDNETIGSDPFTNAAGGDYSVKDLGNLRRAGDTNFIGLASTPTYRYKGAVSPDTSGGGGGSTFFGQLSMRSGGGMSS